MFNMIQRGDEIQTYSDPKLAAQCVFILIIVVIAEALFLLLAFNS